MFKEVGGCSPVEAGSSCTHISGTCLDSEASEVQCARGLTLPLALDCEAAWWGGSDGH